MGKKVGDKWSNLFDNGRADVVIARAFSSLKFSDNIKDFLWRGRMEEDGFMKWCLKEIMKVGSGMNLVG